jgi:methylmalonyl-CoA mutase N-terminal domain/subunit
VESLTDAMEERLIEIMADIEAHGGMVRAIEDGYVQGLIADEAWRAQRAVESGERPVVGVNVFTTDEPRPDIQIYGLDESGRERQLNRLAEVRRTRDGIAVVRALGELNAAAGRDDVNLMPLLIEAVEAYCTVGEIVSTLKDAWGEYRQPAVF